MRETEWNAIRYAGGRQKKIQTVLFSPNQPLLPEGSNLWTQPTLNSELDSPKMTEIPKNLSCLYNILNYLIL